jgi:hypothetical protein
MTDRGRVWILLGKPQSETRLPSASRIVPSEVWFYSVDPALGLPPFFYVVFFKDNGVGEYRMWSPAMDGPAKLLDPAGQQELRNNSGRGGAPGPGSRMGMMDADSQAVQMLRQVDQELASAAGSLIPGEGIGMGVSPLRSEMVLSRLLDLPNVLMPNATWAYGILAGITESTVRFETLPMQAAAIGLIDPAGEPFVHFLVRTVGDRLNLNNYQDRYYLTFDIGSSVRDGDLRVLDDRPVRTLQTDVESDMARQLRGGPLQYMERIPVIPGDYTIDLVLENNVSREFARNELAVRVPAANPERRGGSPAMLAQRAQELGDEYSSFGPQFPFQVGPLAVIPALDGPFPSGGELTVYRQLYIPAGDVEPLLQHVALVDSGGTVRVEKFVRVDPWDRNEHGVIDQLVRIDLDGIAPGDYTVTVALEGEASAQQLPLRVIDAEGFTRPFLHSLPFPPAADPVVQLARARQLRTVGRSEQAIELLTELLARSPDQREALDLQLELLRDAGRYSELEELLAPLLAASPNAAELLLQAAEVKAMQGEHFDAIRYYERARIGGAAETPELLNALASEYWAEQRATEAAELLRRSLEIDPDQPQMRRLLEELEGALGSPV